MSEAITAAAVAICTANGIPEVEGVPVGRIVHECHERLIDDGLAVLAVPGLHRATLEPVLTYCAEMRCASDQVACPGCKRRTEADGITSLEMLLARHGEVVTSRGLTIRGQGTGRLEIASIDELAGSWTGEEYWYWARRVLRKLRYGIRRAHISGEPAGAEADTPAILLMEPQLPDNIGMVARAMGNFALDRLRLVNPRDAWPNEKARIAASGANYVIDEAVAFPDVTAAMADLNYVVATTARQRDMRKPVLTPEQAIAEIRRRIAAGERCGILFGRERNGLETDEVAPCDAIVMIPVNSSFASLNLAQAVLILGYEWIRTSPAASLGRVTTYERPKDPGINLGPHDRRATKEEVAGLMEHLRSELTRLGFFTPPRNASLVMRGVETMFVRCEPTEQEVKTLRGIVATLAHGKGKARKPST